MVVCVFNYSTKRYNCAARLSLCVLCGTWRISWWRPSYFTGASKTTVCRCFHAWHRVLLLNWHLLESVWFASKIPVDWMYVTEFGLLLLNIWWCSLKCCLLNNINKKNTKTLNINKIKMCVYLKSSVGVLGRYNHVFFIQRFVGQSL